MPRHTEWIQRIPPALDALRALPCPTVDRLTFQSLFQISPRHAVRILSSLGAYAAGKCLLIERHDLIAKLEALQCADTIQIEQARHERVSVHLERYRKDQAARRRTIEVPLEALSSRLASLPRGVSLYRRSLHIDFQSPEDLLRKLFTLAQAISNDYPAFEQALD